MSLLKRMWSFFGWWRRKRRTLPMRIARGVIHSLSLSALFLVVLATVVTREIPPFFGWIDGTPVEATGRYVVGFLTKQTLVWRRRLASLPLLPNEKRTRDFYVAEIKRKRPTHTVRLRRGRPLYGWLETQENGRYTLLHETAKGWEKLPLAEDDIRSQFQIEYAPVELAAKDVRFLSGFPGFDYYHLPPYLIVSSAKYPLVRRAHIILSELSRDFHREFAPLIAHERQGRLIYACIFRDEGSYFAHAVKKEDVDLTESTGFYSQTEDCLFVYDRMQSLARISIDRSVERWIDESQSQGPRHVARVRRHAEAERYRAYRTFRKQIVTTLRHEGAHELAFALGVHSAEGFEHLWVQEGLALYCETTPFGTLIGEQVRILAVGRANGKLIDWATLVNTPTPAGFVSYGDRASQAYAQSWLLFRLLMGARHKAQFVAFLESIRSMTPGQLKRPRSELLEQSLGVPFEEIVAELDALINRRGSAPPEAR